MPITKIHCSSCDTEFVDARSEVRAGDEATCPHCGARHMFEAWVPRANEFAMPARVIGASASDREE